VWLEGDAGYGTEDMREALLRPKLTLYLGRKSCPPGFPLLPETLRAANVAEALGQYDSLHGEQFVAKGKRLAQTQLWSDAGHDIPGVEERSTLYSVRDVLTNSSKRQFGIRQERHFILQPQQKEADHVHE